MHESLRHADFDIGTGKSFVLNNTQSLAVPQSFVLTLQIPYDVPTQLNIGVVGKVVPSQTAIDFSDCGAPGPWVPEPSDYAFMLAGLAVLNLTARTRKSKTQCNSLRTAVGHNLPVADGGGSICQ